MAGRTPTITRKSARILSRTVNYAGSNLGELFNRNTIQNDLPLRIAEGDPVTGIPSDGRQQFGWNDYGQAGPKFYQSRYFNRHVGLAPSPQVGEYRSGPK